MRAGNRGEFGGVGSAHLAAHAHAGLLEQNGEARAEVQRWVGDSVPAIIATLCRVICHQGADGGVVGLGQLSAAGPALPVGGAGEVAVVDHDVAFDVREAVLHQPLGSDPESFFHQVGRAAAENPQVAVDPTVALRAPIRNRRSPDVVTA